MTSIPHELGQTQAVRGTRLARRVLLIGWDGADSRTLLPLLHSGQLTHIASLLNSGTQLELSVPRPSFAPAAWTSLATGTPPHEHGILHSHVPSPDTSRLEPVTSRHRCQPAIWGMLGRHGLQSNVVGWPLTFPAERIPGVCVADFSSPAGGSLSREAWSKAAVYPNELYSALMSQRVTPAQLDDITVTQLLTRSAMGLPQLPQLTAACRSILADAATQFRMLRWCLSERPWDFSACVFPGLRRIHEVANWLIGVNPEATEAARDLLAGCYEHHDLLLGQLLQQVGEDTHVLAIALPSDAGNVGSSTGIAVVRGPGIHASTTASRRSILHVAPSVLTMLGIPCSAEMRGETWRDLFVAATPQSSIDKYGLPIEDLIPEDRPVAAAIEPISSLPDVSIEHLVQLGYVDPSDAAEREAVRNCQWSIKLHRVLSLIDSRDLEAAISEHNELIQDYPDSHRARAQLAECLFHAGRRDEARDQIEWLRLHGNEQPQVYYLSAAIEFADRNLPAALEELQGTRRGAIRLPAADLLAGDILLRQRKFAASRAAFQSAIQGAGPSPDALSGLAAIELQANAPEAAAENALNALALDMTCCRGHYYLAIALTQLGRPLDAIQALQSWAAVEPMAAAPYRWMSRVCSQSLQDVDRSKSYSDQGREVVRQRRQVKSQSAGGTSRP